MTIAISNSSSIFTSFLARAFPEASGLLLWSDFGASLAASKLNQATQEVMSVYGSPAVSEKYISFTQAANRFDSGIAGIADITFAGVVKKPAMSSIFIGNNKSGSTNNIAGDGLAYWLATDVLRFAASRGNAGVQTELNLSVSDWAAGAWSFIAGSIGGNNMSIYRGSEGALQSATAVMPTGVRAFSTRNYGIGGSTETGVGSFAGGAFDSTNAILWSGAKTADQPLTVYQYMRTYLPAVNGLTLS